MTALKTTFLILPPMKEQFSKVNLNIPVNQKALEEVGCESTVPQWVERFKSNQTVNQILVKPRVLTPTQGGCTEACLLRYGELDKQPQQ